MKRVDILTSLVLIALAVIGIFWTVPQETVAGEPGEIAPADLPQVALWTITVCAVWQLLVSIRGNDDTASPLDGFTLVFLATGALALVAILFGIWWLGYIAGGMLCILVIGAAMRPTGATWAWLVGVAIALPVGIYVMSWHGLRLSLP